jgi:ABC-type glycerol-3-phosphate transport system permease component
LALHPNLFTTGAGFLELLINAIQAGSRSFAGAILISFLANYLIQNRVPLKNRFLFSAVFSALMGIYYALSKVWF